MHISVDDSLGSIGRLRSLTSLFAEFNEFVDYIELDLQNPELQLLHLTAPGDDEGTWFDGMAQVCACFAHMYLYMHFTAFQNGHHCFASHQHLLVLPEYAACLQDGRMWRCLSALCSLRSLHLCNFWLAYLPAEVMLLTTLTSLRIDNGLSSMSRDLSPLENLVELRLSCDRLSWRFPVMLSTCRSLEELVLTECSMKIGNCFDVLMCLPRLQQVTMGRDRYSSGAENFPYTMRQLARHLPSVKLSFEL